MAKQRPKQLELSKTGFDGDEDGWVFVKKQRVIIVLPSLPVTEHFTLEKPATTTSLLEAELRDGVADTQESTFVHTVVPSLHLPQHFILQKPDTSQSQAELRHVIADTHKTSPVRTVVPSLPLPENFILQKRETLQSQVELRDGSADTHETSTLHKPVPSLPVIEHVALHKPVTPQSQAALRDFIPDMNKTIPLLTVVPSLPPPEHFILQKPATSQSQAELRADTLKTTLVHAMVPSLPVPEHCTLQKPATSKSQVDLRTETRKATLVHTVMPSLPVPEHYTLQKPASSQSQAELRADTRKATLVVPSLPVTELCTLQKPAAFQSQAELRDLVADTHETSHVHTMEPEACPDFTSVDKPEVVMGRNLTTRKAPAPRRSVQDCRKNPDRQVEFRRRRTGHKPIRFPRVMCSSVVMDNEKLRVLNLEKKVEKAGGLNEWVGSIGLGREFERMLRGQRMSKFQMANLTMEKLKHMGALAVGPRRKLIHAICCVYYPHCLRASYN